MRSRFVYWQKKTKEDLRRKNVGSETKRLGQMWG